MRLAGLTSIFARATRLFSPPDSTCTFLSTSSPEKRKAPSSERTLVEGNLPRKQAKLVLAWAEIHQEDLMADWNLLMNGEEPFKIQ
ncbi:MAG: DUF4160 domain-containing protein, partial [Candidatus Electrothrix sp. AR5]|nr:DUF4160 domain-containing protein [Candidatus Electrothrix sp. AR5]